MEGKGGGCVIVTALFSGMNMIVICYDDSTTREECEKILVLVLS